MTLTTKVVFPTALTVSAEFRRQGVGKSLIAHLINQKLRVQVGAGPGSYLFPGIDIARYAPAVALFESLGFTEKLAIVSMDRNLDDIVAGQLGDGVRVPTEEERALLVEPMTSEFGEGWGEVIRSAPLDRLLLLEVEGNFVGFSHWNGERFGPIGVLRSMRGRKLGDRLTFSMLARQKAAGHNRAFFMWSSVGLAQKFYEPLGFQTRRRFTVLEFTPE